MPIHQLDNIADTWAECVATMTPTNQPNYFQSQRMRNRSKTDSEADEHIRWLITANGKILMEKVKQWYDNDID